MASLQELRVQVNWLTVLQSLNRAGCLVVKHEPDDTARYERARTQLPFVLKRSHILGTRFSVGHEDYAIDVACWCQSPAGRACGFFTVFRVIADANAPSWATMFCFWDGTDSSPCFRGTDSAKAYALQQGFAEVKNEA
jgi:hypothetical protein